MKATTAKPPVMQDTRTGSPALVGLFTAEIVTRKTTEVLADGELTIGEMIDEHLHQMADDGAEVRTVSFEFSPEMWQEYRAMFAPRSAEATEAWNR